MAECATRTLCGSAALIFTSMMPSPPLDPPLSWITTGCFMSLYLVITLCSTRAIWSDAPPAPAGTTISTAFVGSQAHAGLHSIVAIAVASAARLAKAFHVLIGFLLLVSLCFQAARRV